MAQEGVVLDVVELRLETRGFIDKPISFEIDKEKIVGLLIGDHLYSQQDVAIRELIQNSIDSCKLKTSIDTDFPCKIILHRFSNNELIIYDNGLGMDYHVAKQFLSKLGSSFYNSQLFQETYGEDTYSPISKYGIGILSSFLICDKIIIETKKDGHEACKFTIGSVNEEWKYEKGSLADAGTKITLNLNEEGKKIKICDSLNRYFLCPEIPIEYAEQGKEYKKFKGAWKTSQIYEKFILDPEEKSNKKIPEILNESCADYDFIVTMDSEWVPDQVVLFNHGIYVGEFSIETMQSNVHVMVNLKKDLVDIHLSRENIKRNAKLNNFIYSLFEKIFQSINKKYKDNNIMIFSQMLNRHVVDEVNSETELFDHDPFLKCFIKHAPVPIVTNKKIEIVNFGHVLSGQDLIVYKCCSYSISEELCIISSIIGDASIIINPYELQKVSTKKNKLKKQELLKYLLDKKKVRHTEVDFLKILINSSKQIDVNYPEILPKNVRLATFSKEIKPLVVVYSQPVVKTHDETMGSSYWGNILLWKELMEKDRLDCCADVIREFYDDRFEKVTIIEEPIVYIDSSDTLIRSVLDKRSDGEFESNISKKIHRYFKYLSYLPLVIHNMESNIIFLEVIDKLEADICSSLQLERCLPILKRIKPKLILQYYNRYGLNYIERQEGNQQS